LSSSLLLFSWDEDEFPILATPVSYLGYSGLFSTDDDEFPSFYQKSTPVALIINFFALSLAGRENIHFSNLSPKSLKLRCENFIWAMGTKFLASNYDILLII
jgi:hypothetical protein